MKKFAYMLLFTSAWAFANTDDSSTIKSSVKSITSSITSSSKDALSGLKEGGHLEVVLMAQL